MRHEVICTEEGFIFKIPKDFMVKNLDWKFSMILELSLMMAKPDDFIKEEKHST